MKQIFWFDDQELQNFRNERKQDGAVPKNSERKTEEDLPIQETKKSVGS